MLPCAQADDHHLGWNHPSCVLPVTSVIGYEGTFRLALGWTNKETIHSKYCKANQCKCHKILCPV